MSPLTDWEIEAALAGRTSPRASSRLVELHTVVRDLREQLIVPPDPGVAEAHVGAMAAVRPPRLRLARRFLARSFAAAAVLATGTGALAAAGGLSVLQSGVGPPRDGFVVEHQGEGQIGGTDPVTTHGGEVSRTARLTEETGAEKGAAVSEVARENGRGHGFGADGPPGPPAGKSGNAGAGPPEAPPGNPDPGPAGGPASGAAPGPPADKPGNPSPPGNPQPGPPDAPGNPDPGPPAEKPGNPNPGSPPGGGKP